MRGLRKDLGSWINWVIMSIAVRCLVHDLRNAESIYFLIRTELGKIYSINIQGKGKLFFHVTFILSGHQQRMSQLMKLLHGHDLGHLIMEEFHEGNRSSSGSGSGSGGGGAAGGAASTIAGV